MPGGSSSNVPGGRCLSTAGHWLRLIGIQGLRMGRIIFEGIIKLLNFFDTLKTSEIRNENIILTVLPYMP